MKKAIVHFDGDAFFASVEQALDHTLRGKAVVTGRERFIAASMSYQAKAKGVTRGMPIFEIKKVCPEAIFVPSNYNMYSIFARRMYNIVRTFTPHVEEYSIDECFADITGLDKTLKMSYEEIAIAMKNKLETSLGITFGVGLGPNKVLAKMASKHNKPAGFTSLLDKDITPFLEALPIGKIWGIGGSGSVALNNFGVRTALDFTKQSLRWLDAHHIVKPYKEIYYELQGKFVKELQTEPSLEIASIIKSRTFTPPSSRREFILSQLLKNIEAACLKARFHKVRAREIRFYLKTQDFRYEGLDLPLPLPSSTPIEIMRLITPHFDKVYRKNTIYRTTGIVLKGLIKEESVQHDLFGGSEGTEATLKIFEVIDKLNKRFGNNAVFLGGSHMALKKEDELLLPQKEERVDIPFLGKVK
jgi:nucleotidyltransferase/DNA polymerase involved in DNA repair